MRFKRAILIYQYISAWWSHYTSLLIIPSLSLKSILSLFHVFLSTIIPTLSSWVTSHLPVLQALPPGVWFQLHHHQTTGTSREAPRKGATNQVIKLQPCNIKQKVPPSLPRLDGNGWVGGWRTWHDGPRCCWFPQRLSTHSCWVNNSDPCLIKITDHPPLRKTRQFENYSN